jgi:hypothetical protein
MYKSFFKTVSKFRIPRIVKRIFNFSACLFLTICCFFVSYLTFQNGWMNLGKVDQFEGVITEKGVILYHTSTSGAFAKTITNQAFQIKLKGLNQTLAVYNPQQSYGHLENNLNVGDTIKVFYKFSSLTEKLNLGIFQIEKNNLKLLNGQDFQDSERKAFYITFFGGFVLLFLTFYQDRKYKHYL